MECPQPCVVSSWGLLSSLHLGGYTSAEHVASAGDVGNQLLILSTEPVYGVHGLFIDGVADKIGGHSLVLCSTNGCFDFAKETCPSQPLMGLCK
eukprot:13256399-Ditylum_brightwellii.AAC.1